jgi:glycine hydroxymethyltransferase
MKKNEHLNNLLKVAAKEQDNFDLSTTNLIAPASPTKLNYINIPLKHATIAEGILKNRSYAGLKWFNRIEQIAVEAACDLFGAEHANVQPHSVSQANQAVYQALLKPGDKVLAMKFESGGHLTHGLPINFSGRFYNFNFYDVGTDGYIDYEALWKQAKKIKPKLIICGASSYPRSFDFKKLRNISKKVGAYLLGDLCHPAGLIAAGVFPKPFPYCDVVTLTPDKTMLGPHGGIILCKKELSLIIDKSVHPGVQSSVPLRRIYEMAVCLIESSQPWFKDFAKRIIQNTKEFEKVFNKYPELMITGGSDTHLITIKTLKVFGLTGKEAENLLEQIGILTNRQVIPGEKLESHITSGLRLGTTWITARGYSKLQARRVANILLINLENPNNKKLMLKSKRELLKLLNRYKEKDVWKNESKTIANWNNNE